MTVIEDLALIQVIFTRYILFTCAVLGLIGSLLNLLVFCQNKFRSNSCSVYFIATSIFNILVILGGITSVLLTSYLPNEPALSTSAFCKTRAYLTHVFLMMSRSSVALACVDRFALCSPNAYIRRLNQRRKAIILVIAVSVLWLIVPIHVIIYNNVQMPGKRCGASGLYSIIYSIYAAIATSIPLTTMVVFSFLALQNLRDVHARIQPTTTNVRGNLNAPIRVRKRDVQLMIILISEVVVYFLSTVSFPIYSIYMAITLNTSKTASRSAIEGFIRYLTLSFLIFLNSCSIFYVHLFTSKLFRQECTQLLRRLFKLNQNNRVVRATFKGSNIRGQLNQNYNRQQPETFPSNNHRMHPLLV